MMSITCALYYETVLLSTIRVSRIKSVRRVFPTVTTGCYPATVDPCGAKEKLFASLGVEKVGLLHKGLEYRNPLT